jgi:hypothetical protein
VDLVGESSRIYVEDHLGGAVPLACDGEEGRKSTVILDILSALAPDGREVAVDYGQPLPADPGNAAALGLLG